ncbi:MAG: hypothetical protein Q4G68_00625 [Planctomycetia bacterium]|nr:hypothetical protein [Planctomycetia bacterium]
MKKRHIRDYAELRPLVEEMGILPLFPGAIQGYSLWDYTDEADWFQGDSEYDPWEWRCRAAAEGHLAYGKFFGGKAGFISRTWFPVFVNARRRGLTFDAIRRKEKWPEDTRKVMALFQQEGEFPSNDVKKRSGLTRSFDRTVTLLQHKTYLLTTGFFRKRSKEGLEYGWSTAILATAETYFGTQYVHSCSYDSWQDSRQEILDHVAGMFPRAPSRLLHLFLD